MILKEYEGFTNTISNIHPSWINITIPEHNQEVAQCLQELASALLIQMLFQAHLIGNTSHDYQSLQQFLLICKWPLTTPYQLLCIVGHRALHWVVIGIDTIHPQVIYLLVGNSLI